LKTNLRYNNWGYAHANEFGVLAEGLDMSRLWAIVTGENMNPSGNLSFTKRWMDVWKLNPEGWDHFG
jgi:hypothetical protein